MLNRLGDGLPPRAFDAAIVKHVLQIALLIEQKAGLAIRRQERLGVGQLVCRIGRQEFRPRTAGVSGLDDCTDTAGSTRHTEDGRATFLRRTKVTDATGTGTSAVSYTNRSRGIAPTSHGFNHSANSRST